jgi:4-hydroxybenzoate polyprenyltransferase
MDFSTYFKLVRYKNLLLIIYVFLLIKFVLFPSFYITTTLSIFQFFTLLFSVLFISAAGYIINDIIDVKADEINKPNKVIVSKKLSIEKAQQWYKTTNTIGLSLGILLCLNLNKPTYSFLFIATALLLYFYSKKIKAIPFLGNFVISLLIALSIIILPLFELHSSNKSTNQNIVIYIILLLTFFAFSLNLIREIIKDIEDIDGDYTLKINTLPILFGRNRIKNFVSVISFFPLGILIFIITIYSSIYKITMLYLVIFTFIPLLYTTLKLRTATKKNEFHKLSLFLKIIMFLGITSLIIISIFH